VEKRVFQKKDKKEGKVVGEGNLKDKKGQREGKV